MNESMIRHCPGCGVENPPQQMRCGCGVLLVGVDLTQSFNLAAPAEASAPPATTSASPITTSVLPATASAPPASIVCPFDDCGQSNPPGSLSCLYCNRPLSLEGPEPPRQSLLRLPASLASRYRLLQPLATQGAEAELMLLEPLAGGAPLVAKVYRHGMQPQAAIHERLKAVAPQFRVQMLESGQSDGHFYELMAYYRYGAWRTQMQHGALHEGALNELVRALAPALAAIHAAGLIHRDLKPENILVSQLEPLQLLLTDFGSASVLDATQRFTGNARTLPYAAPESLSGVIDTKADYWAFGMIVLECALGAHPFANLSEAVIMHHLSTRSMDLSGVPMPAIRKLLRGLLLRDPALRWGASEVSRWLAQDPTLREPVDSGSSHFKQPYHLGQEVCDTPEQLAIALARNWKLAVADSENGQLLAWFRDVQQDQNTVRLLLGLRHDQQMQVDLRLLKLILHLAPGIVPMWRGEVLDLRTVLGRAARALKGEQDAVDWLDECWRQQVLQLYAGDGAASGNSGLAALLTRWNTAYDQFIAAWDEVVAQLKPPKQQEDFANIDDMLYGGNELERPAVAGMHARLLAMAHDENWLARLRERLAAQYAEIAVDCPWYLALGQVADMNGAALLVLDCLLPQARKAQQRARATRERRQATRQNQLRELQRNIANAIHDLQELAQENWLNAAICQQMRKLLDELFDHYATLHSAGRAEADWQQLDQICQSSKQTAYALRQALDALEAQHVVNSGWLNRYTLIFTAIALLLALSRGPRLFLPAMLLVAGLAFWRWQPMPGMMRQIRLLARKLVAPD